MTRQGKRLVVGPLGPHVEGFRSFALAWGYTPATTGLLVKEMRSMSAWMLESGHGVGDVSEGLVAAYRAWLPGSGRRRVPTPGEFRALLAYCRELGLAQQAPAAPTGGVDGLLDSYRAWLRDQRGLSTATITGYSATARLFLRSLPATDAGPCWDAVTGLEVNAFLLSARDRLATGSVKTRVNHVRAFLRFAHLQGWIGRDLGRAVPPVAGWTHASVPASLSGAQVQALIDGCDPADGTQVRDRAILLLLARLGLRSIEIARLELDDIDWRAGQVTIRGKGRRRDVLPLPDDVGTALVAYLRLARHPNGECRRVFVMRRCPRGPIPADLVHDVVRRACRRAGLPVVGAHRLRHSLATSMLAAGVPLVEISQVLRHADIATTLIYAKVDTTALGQLARPWPTGPAAGVGRAS